MPWQPEECSEKEIIQIERDITQHCEDNCHKLRYLIDVLQPNLPVKPAIRVKCLHAIRRLLSVIYDTFQLNTFTTETANASETSLHQVEKWLRRQSTRLIQYLEELCTSPEENVSICALMVGASISAQFSGWSQIFRPQVYQLLTREENDWVWKYTFNNFIENMFSVFADISLQTFIVITSILQSSKQKNYSKFHLSNYLSLLKKGTTIVSSFLSCGKRLEKELSRNTSEVDSHQNFYKHLKRSFTNAWLSFLSVIPMSEELYCSVLEDLGSKVIPLMTRPLLLVDHLTTLYEKTSLSLLALDAIFVLIRDYGLDYPSFYDKLYTLLTLKNLSSPKHSTFLKLFSKLLLSALNIPEYTAAAFVKKLVRLSTRLPPKECVWCLTCAVNLIAKYPSLSCLVHKMSKEQATAFSFHQSITNETTMNNSASLTTLSGDPFNEFQPNCEDSMATVSSLWELELIQHHYLPFVSQQFQQFTKDWSLERSKRKGTNMIPPKPDDILEMKYESFLNDKKRKLSDPLWPSESNNLSVNPLSVLESILK
eukprot:jgi/Galph1/1023/GphlegSOOS_G5761.1